LQVSLLCTLESSVPDLVCDDMVITEVVRAGENALVPAWW
jgi:hypothetical protein